MDRTKFSDADFEDIRPYRDHEIRGVLERVRKNPWIVSALRRFFWPNTPEFLVPLVEAFVRFYLRCRLVGIHTLDDWHQRFVRKTVLEWVEQRTMTELTYSGVENPKENDPALFITNHRDIVLDSAFLAYGLMCHGMRSPEIAFGDNLMINPFVADLIRMNKSFIVKRNLPLRRQVEESKRLSQYIWYRLGQGESIWLAQRAGRAKDGDDRTAPSVIKMLFLSQRKGGLGLSEFINALNIIPVSISYEYDPCDKMKAREVFMSRMAGGYSKSPREDLISILRGINEPKGRVHFAFCPPLRGSWEEPKDVAEDIERSIILNYKLWPTAYAAYDLYYGTEEYADKYTEEDKAAFVKRFASLSEDVRKVAYEIYARPLMNQKAILGER